MLSRRIKAKLVDVLPRSWQRDPGSPGTAGALHSLGQTPAPGLGKDRRHLLL